MPMYLRRIVDSFGFILGSGVGAWLRYGQDASWFTAIGLGVVVFAVTPFVLSQVLALYFIRHLERQAIALRQMQERDKRIE